MFWFEFFEKFIHRYTVFTSFPPVLSPQSPSTTLSQIHDLLGMIVNVIYIHSTHISFRVAHVYMGLGLTARDWIIYVDPISILTIHPYTKDLGNFAEEGAGTVEDSEDLDFCCEAMPSM